MPEIGIAVTDGMRETARALEPDRYLAALLAPPDARADLIVLSAFVSELKRIPLIVGDPHLAEIRLTWWRDALLSPQGAASGNPIADATQSVIARHGLNRDALATWLDAFAHTFYASSPQDEAHLDLELSLIEGTPFAFAAKICGAPQTEDVAAACNSAGIAYGLARLGLDFPRVLARGRVPLPGVARDGEDAATIAADTARNVLSSIATARLEALKGPFSRLDKRARTALLPLALVEPYLRACCIQGHDLTRELAEVAPLTRVWRIWLAHLSGRI